LIIFYISFNQFGIKTISKKSEYSYLPQNIAYIWAEYVSDCQKDGELVIEMNTKNLEYNGKSTTFDYIIRGNYIEPGFPLYIILHNGGIGQSGFNNGEYLKAKFRYASSVKFGVLLGIKGINDLSNMHYTNESIILLDRIIKNFISFHQVNPNKVYLIGIGMGGDAVYQIVNLLPSKFAAAVVVSGHSYKKNLKNLINVPILIQVGEKDFLYDRNKDAVFTYKRIKDFYDNFNQRMFSLN
jgi:predicted peptidase